VNFALAPLSAWFCREVHHFVRDSRQSFPLIPLMQTIGEKLEEARKRRGISLREASEVTKIRSEYLANFESNSFDLPVPPIYVRGFLRSYATFLKLNPEKVITDYNAHVLGESKFARRDSREFLGRMDLAKGPEDPDAPGAATEAADAPMPPVSVPKGPSYLPTDKSALVKIGVAMGAAAVVITISVVIIFAILRSGSGDAGAIAQTQNSPAAAAKKEIVLLAEGGDILQVIVTEVTTGREIYRGDLPSGQSRRIAFDDQVRLTYTHAEYLFIEQEGVRYQIGGRGMRQSTFPQRPRPQQL
jgi:cytoskeleton protein RodZ